MAAKLEAELQTSRAVGPTTGLNTSEERWAGTRVCPDRVNIVENGLVCCLAFIQSLSEVSSGGHVGVESVCDMRAVARDVRFSIGFRHLRLASWPAASCRRRLG